MAATPHALFETQTLQRLAHIVKTDGRVGGAAQNAAERFLGAHYEIFFTVSSPIRGSRVDLLRSDHATLGERPLMSHLGGPVTASEPD